MSAEHWYLLICEGCPDYKRPSVDVRLEFFDTESAAKGYLVRVKQRYIEERCEEIKGRVCGRSGRRYFVDDQWRTLDDAFDRIIEARRDSDGYIVPYYEWHIGKVDSHKVINL